MENPIQTAPFLCFSHLHIFLLQLWLYATFEQKLGIKIPASIPRFFEGTRLNLLTQEDKGLSTTEAFQKYFVMFHKCQEFLVSMAPFVNRKNGLEWFRRKFPLSLHKKKNWKILHTPKLLAVLQTSLCAFNVVYSSVF